MAFSSRNITYSNPDKFSEHPSNPKNVDVFPLLTKAKNNLTAITIAAFSSNNPKKDLIYPGKIDPIEEFSRAPNVEKAKEANGSTV